MSSPRVAVVGAGLELAGDLVALLLERGIPDHRIRVLDREETAGEALEVGDLKSRVEWASSDAVADVDAALFCGDAALAGELAPLVRRGIAIDGTAFSRTRGDVPLIVPELNGARLSGVARGALLASPSPAAVALSLALAPLHALAGVRRVVATLLEPASQRGAQAVEELSRQSIELMRGRGLDRAEHPEQIAFNVRVHAAQQEAGLALEEESLARELADVIAAPQMIVSATAVRVPVFFGSAQTVYVELGREVDLTEVEKALRSAQGLLLSGSVEHGLALAVEAARRRRAHAEGGSEERDADERDEDEELAEDGLEIDEEEGDLERREREELEDEEGDRRGRAPRAGGSDEEPADDRLPGPVEVAGSEFVHIARLRLDARRSDALAFWLAFDELRRGVALNLVGILELALNEIA